MSRDFENAALARADDVLVFWFQTLSPKDWFKQKQRVDADIEARFGATHAAAARCELWRWRASAPGRLAEIIVLDQFSRNIHRGDARAFANDRVALALAQQAVAAGADRQLTADERAFIYMPFMHSESLSVHADAEPLFEQAGLETTAKNERRHREVLERFGRYPQRNAALGRTSTAREKAFLQASGAGF